MKYASDSKMKQRKITIEADIKEDVFMESMLNQYYTGYDVSLMFGLYALAHSWKTDKLFYYMKLMEIRK